MATYNTDSKARVEKYLAERKGQHCTISDIYANFEKQGIHMGQTTIYRRVEELVKKGVVKKYIIDSQSAACFEYVGEEDDTEPHYHLKCEECGKLVHFDCEEAKILWNHLTKKHNFQINLQRTVIYGVCDKCTKKEPIGR